MKCAFDKERECNKDCMAYYEISNGFDTQQYKVIYTSKCKRLETKNTSKFYEILKGDY